MFLGLKVVYECVLKKTQILFFFGQNGLPVICENVDKKRHAWDGFMKMTFVIVNIFIFVFSPLSQTCY